MLIIKIKNYYKYLLKKKFCFDNESIKLLEVKEGNDIKISCNLNGF